MPNQGRVERPAKRHLEPLRRKIPLSLHADSVADTNITTTYLQYVDANSIVGLREISSGYYTGLDAIFLALKKLNQKGRGAGIL